MSVIYTQMTSTSIMSIECAIVDVFRMKSIENNATWAVLKVMAIGEHIPIATDLGLSTIFHLSGIVPFGFVVKDHIKCEGSVVKHSQYGMEFKATDISLVKPNTLTRVRDTLAEVVGVGRMVAVRAVHVYENDDDMIGAMINDPNRMVAAVGEHSAGVISQTLKNKWRVHDGSEFLRTLGVRTSDIKKICNCATFSGQDIQTVLSTNPFAIVNDVGFKMCDAMRSLMGMPMNMPERLDAGVDHIAKTQCTNRGHCAVEKDSLVIESAETLRVIRNEISLTIARLVESGQFIERESIGTVLLWPKKYWDAEQDTIEAFHRIILADTKVEFEEVDEVEVADALGFVPSEDQWDALRTIARSRIAVLTGGPGTGKTSIIRYIIDRASSSQQKVLLCAPTGLAALRMKDACSHPSSTMHRAISGTSEVKLVDADIIVVDEMSMVGIELFRDLITKVRADATVLLVGDVDQLPSISPGNVLTDIIDSRVIPVCRLNKTHRQGAGSLICENIARIREGEMPVEIPGSNEFVMRFFDSGSTIIEATKVCTNMLLTGKMAAGLFDVQVIVPTNAGDLGAEGLNRELRPLFNSAAAESKKENAAKYLPGDKVIQCQNDYERNVINGEIGRVSEIMISGGVVVQFTDHAALYNLVEQNDLKPAYAISVHKSQGSEFPYIILVITEANGPLLSRRLLYTAFSRGRKKVALIGQKSAIEKALANTKNDVRYTGLAAGLATRFE